MDFAEHAGVTGQTVAQSVGQRKDPVPHRRESHLSVVAPTGSNRSDDGVKMLHKALIGISLASRILETVGMESSFSNRIFGWEDNR
jgi:hypothetical protein